MTDHREEAGGTAAARRGADQVAAAAARLRRQVPALARETIDRYIAGAERFAESGIPDHLQRESTHTVRTLMRTCVASLTEEEPPVEAAIREASARSVDRVADDLSLDEYMRCGQVAFAVLAEALVRELPDPALAPGALARMRSVSDLIARKTADAYSLAARDIEAAASRQDSEALDALWAGRDWPFRSSATLPSAPLAVHLHLSAAPGEEAAGHRDRSNVRHRKVRQVRAHLRRDFPDIWLMDVQERTGRILSWSHTAGLGDPAALARSCTALTDLTGVQLTAAMEPAADLADIPRAALVAREALETALRLGRSGEQVTMADLALDHHLGHESTALPFLLERSGPVLSRAELRETVRRFIDCDQDRRATARALGVHPNTVDNRLARVRELTGLNVHCTRDLITLSIGVLAPVMRSQSPTG